MKIIGGDQGRTVQPGDVVQLEAHYGTWTAGPDECGAHWFVNYVEGGTEELGTVDDCGRYQAPDAFPPGLALLVIEASDGGGDLYACSDCCPHAEILLYPRSDLSGDEAAELQEWNFDPADDVDELSLRLADVPP